MESLQNLDLLSVGLAVASTVVLGFVIYFSNPKSVTNITFLVFSIITALLGSINYSFYNITEINIAFWLLRLVLFFAIWQSFLIFTLFYIFPDIKKKFPNWYKFILFPLVLLTSLSTLTPLVLKEVSTISEGRIVETTNGPLLPLFGLVFSTLSFTGIIILLRKFKKAEKKYRKSLQLILFGTIATFSLLIIFNLILPSLADNSRFVPLGALFTFPFVLFTSYAILKHKLFNIKVTGISLLVFALSIVAFGEVIFANELPIMIYRSSVFALILIIGISLIKGVLREVSLREQLEEANKAQENLLHFITHQIKGFLTKSKNIFAELIEGTFGPLSDDVRQISEQGLKINNDAVTTVQTILNAANIKTGKIVYDKKPVDLKALVKEIFGKHKSNAEDKGLSYNLEIDESQEFNINGDIGKLKEAFSNLIDNSIKYTPQGKVDVSLVKSSESRKAAGKSGGVIKFSVKDTGVGILPEDRKNLFTEGGRGANAQKINVDSTGFGLYIVKNIVEAHGGTIRVESEGEGKGSEFVVELPVS